MQIYWLQVIQVCPLEVKLRSSKWGVRLFNFYMDSLHFRWIQTVRKKEIRILIRISKTRRRREKGSK